MSLEQMYLLIHHTGTVKRVTCLWNRCISRYITLEQLLDSGVVSLVPVDTRHRALTVPATDAAVPGRPSLSPPRCWSAPGRSREKLLTPSVLASVQRRWNHRPRRVWRRAVAWVRPPVECRRPSAPRRGAAVVRRVPPLSERRHRPRSLFTDTICIPGASAAAPEFPPSPRRLADPLRHLPYICKSEPLES